MAITTILCDLDGTLADSRRDITAAFQDAWLGVVGGISPSAAAIAQHIGKPLSSMLDELGGRISPSVCSTFLSIYRESYRSRDARMTLPYPGVIPTLQALSKFTLGVVTTKEPEQAEIVLRWLGLNCFFKHIEGLTGRFVRQAGSRYRSSGPCHITLRTIASSDGRGYSGRHARR
jgi:phosphoglycolate phosphatase-like HAD superfamily hydrolase